MTRGTRIVLAVALAVAVVAALVIGATVVLTRPTQPLDSVALRQAVTTENLVGHLQALQRVADANGGHRQAGSAGHAASVDYVEGRLKAAGYHTQRQRFSYERQDLGHVTVRRVDAAAGSPAPDASPPGRDARALTNSPPGSLTADVTAVDVNLDGDRRTTSGCETSDFAGFTAGNIALVQRGTCTFEDKVAHAAAAGASAVVIFNQGDARDRQGLFDGGLRERAAIPVVATTYGNGAAWAAGPVTLEIAAETAQTVTTENLIADSPGAAEPTIVVGAHLDGVRDGPGINDNGSGVAAVLEVAVQLAALDAPLTHGVRFAFWSGEEDGLHGSAHYVAGLDEAHRRATALYLNLDMVASPNPAPHVYRGFGALDHPVGGLMRDFLTGQGHEVSDADFRASDHAPFLDAGVPVGGLYTGAGEDGPGGEPADPCYHRACDRADMADDEVLGLMADGLAHGVLSVAQGPVEPR